MTDAEGGICTKEMAIAVDAVPFDCGVAKTDVQDLVWNCWNPTNGCEWGTIAAGVCPDWHMRADNQDPSALPWSGTCSIFARRWDTDICNPGPAYDITITCPYASSGNVLDLDPRIFLFGQIGANGGSISGSLFTDTPNPLVLVISVPATSVSYFSILIQMAAAPLWRTFVALDDAGPLTITPLIHP